MLVLLPPSETKASGGDGPPLRLDTLSHPELTPTRRKLVDELVRLAGDVPAGRVALNLSEHQAGELARNAALWNAPTLFGLLAADDQIPAYRLSVSSSLPEAGTVRSVWRPVLPALLAQATGLVVDLRSGAYAALAPLPDAVTIRVLCADGDGLGSGGGRPASHHNKAHKGRLARLLATAPREVSDADGVARIAHRGGLRVERTGEHALDLIVGV